MDSDWRFVNHDASGLQRLLLPIPIIERSLDEHFRKIKSTIENLANDIFESSQTIEVRWKIQRVHLRIANGTITTKPFSAAEEAANDKWNEPFSPAIEIILSDGMSVHPSDRRINFLRDALFRDDFGEFQGIRGLHGIPFRRHHMYSQFSLAFPNIQGDRPAWYQTSTTVYVPDPATMYTLHPTKWVLEPTKYVQLDMRDEDAILAWAAEYRLKG
ncbi:hypothetical protein GGR54DRAFT_637818 [Hypoxylon sp. NC1633]|nr:hypothetical protein GGR54DRAFT_637818 [Hypoxylon sp. NC1633]